MKNSVKIISIFSFSILLSSERKASAQTTFNYTGSKQTWTVPCGVSSITIDCYGAQGVGANNENHPGYGGEARGVLAVTPGEVLNIFVGGQSGWNGGGAGQGGANGGDASDVRLGGVALSNRIVVAGGGGGAGGDNWLCTGSVYGNGGGGIAVGSNFVGGGGGEGYTSGTGCGANGGMNGGAGGGLGCHGGGGGGAGLTSGGKGAIETCSNDTGKAGTLGQGGASYNSPYCASDGEGTGGGGSGYYGGGGAAGYNCGAGQGGGGSSWTGTLATPYFHFGSWTGVGQIVITQNNAPLNTTDTGKIVSQITCHGGSNGIAYASVTGSAPASTTYAWAPGGQTTDTVTGLSAGTYTVNVAGYCGSATASVTITQPNPMIATGNVVAEVSCYERNNGIASSNVSGGTAPYNYSWAPSGGNNDTATGLSAGIYRVIVIDKNGCSASTTVTITQPDLLTLQTNVTSNVVCGISGNATSSVGGGTIPYNYSWTGGGTNSSINVLSGGAYMLIVTDKNGCSVSSSVMITETPAVFVSATTITGIACNGDNIGAATSIISDGTAPFTYLWNNGATTYSAAGLSAGTYIVNVTDANGCSSSAATTITQPAPLNVVTDSTIDKGACTGSAWVTVSGGVSPYLYEWSNGNTTDFDYGLCRGTFCCTVTDANGCTKYVCISVRSTTGIDNLASSETGQINVYPNPTNGQFTIEAKGEELKGKNIQIYNTLGQQTYTQFNIQHSTFNIDLSNQPNGIYLYRVITDTGILLGEGKIILQK